MGYWPKRIKVKRHNWVTLTGYKLVLARAECFATFNVHQRGLMYHASVGDTTVSARGADACTIKLARALEIIE